MLLIAIVRGISKISNWGRGKNMQPHAIEGEYAKSTGRVLTTPTRFLVRNTFTSAKQFYNLTFTDSRTSSSHRGKSRYSCILDE